MTHRDGDQVVLEVTPAAAPCEFCKRKAELRPYGPSGESICFDCGMLDEEQTRAVMAKQLFGAIDS